MNIVYLLTDQWRYDALGCNGAKVCRTPNIDALASQGCRFTKAYTTNPLCSPARASIMTGLYPHHHGQLANTGNFNAVFDKQVLDKKSYAVYLAENGWNTGYCGKFHLAGEGSFEQWGFRDWRPEWKFNEDLEKKGITYDFGISEVQPLEWGGDAVFCGPSKLDAQNHHDAWVADQTIDIMEGFAGEDKPFMVCAGFHGPHFPYAVPEPYCSMYNPDEVERWENFDETFVNKPEVQQKELMRWNTSHLTFKDWQKVVAVYWGYCTYIDAQVGRIVDWLKEKNLYDDTMIVFSSDHGDMLGGHRMFNKGFNMYEEDTHIPLVVKMPAGESCVSVCGEYVSLVDIAPTFLDAACIGQERNDDGQKDGQERNDDGQEDGQKRQEDEREDGQEEDQKDAAPMDGRSVLGFVRGQEEASKCWRRWLLSEFNGYESTLVTTRMIRNDKWKYIYNPFSVDELYDMESDPAELRNLAALPGFAHVLRRMRGTMYEVLKEAGDSIVELSLWQSNSYGLIISPRET